MTEKPSIERREMEPQPSMLTAPPAQIPPSQPPPAYPTSQPISAAAKGEQYHQERPHFFHSCLELRPYFFLLVLARCAAGQHEYTTRFGPCGIITAIVSSCDFPRV
jgi:hypothetical protein